ncbi:hypothetical protein HMPREF0682_2489 [Propionibacterium acidifaciens F0233]|uniref:Uncharacterized protein n=1 Tax=Propionibacterium acidifaciens F0233 TaxID=553198 RepID=U2RAA4_9ACTN|nr:hypothetical protein HMPREF0682_2489 [Propionibacterium acidifaciens F0233]
MSDEREPVPAGVTQVDDHHRVHSQVHDILTIRTQMNEFSPVQVANENRVLETFTVGLHQLADSTKSRRITNIIGDQVSSSVRPHLVIIAVY